MAKVTLREFGNIKNGEKATLFRIENSNGAYAEITDYGCTIVSLCVPDTSGALVDVCLGYDTIAEYETNDGFLGAAVGRYANRIAKGEFVIKDKIYKVVVNNGPNHLHGGTRGFDKYIWSSVTTKAGVSFSRISSDGEEGFPGTLNITISYEFSDANELLINYKACCDADTIVNLTNHVYFNLAGGGSVLGHKLWLNSDSFTENDENCLPTGKIISVKDCPPMDFTMEKEIGTDIASDDYNLKNGSGYDHNFILKSRELDQKAAILFCEKSGIVMVCKTTQPGVQLYSANFLTKRKGKSGATYVPRDGVCLETQHFPNGLACGFTPSPLLKKDEIFDQTTIYAFSTR